LKGTGDGDCRQALTNKEIYKDLKCVGVVVVGGGGISMELPPVVSK
jgi:hypothetical protein